MYLILFNNLLIKIICNQKCNYYPNESYEDNYLNLFYTILFKMYIISGFMIYK